MARPTTNKVGYFFAEAKDPKAAAEVVWAGGEGSNRQTVHGREVNMKRVSWDIAMGTVQLSCKPK